MPLAEMRLAEIKRNRPLLLSEAGGLALVMGRGYPRGTPRSMDCQMQGDVAVITVCGVLVHRPSPYDAFLGLVPYSEVVASVQDAFKDPAIKGVLLDLDSPGGEVAGCKECADAIHALAKRKPVTAYANDMACSAAYWIAAACTEIHASPTATLGSIGVRVIHVDQSKADADAGFKFTSITGGPRKDELSPHAPLSKAATTSLQNMVDTIYQVFCNHVDELRPGTHAEATNAGVFTASAAMSAGLIDNVCSLDEAIQRTRQITTAPQKGSSTMTRITARKPTSTLSTEAVKAVADARQRNAAPTDLEQSFIATREVNRGPQTFQNSDPLQAACDKIRHGNNRT